MFLRDFVGGCAATYPLETAYVGGGVHRTWSEVHARSDHLAGAMQSLGMRCGDTFGILAHNTVEIAEHWLACLKAGLVRVGINWRYSTREFLHVVRDSGSRFILVQSSCLPLIAGHLDELRAEGYVFIGYGPGHSLELDFETLIAAQHRADYPALSDSDGALIGYTSGSTGLPKGVLLTQGGLRESTIHLCIGTGYVFDDVRLYCTNPAGLNIYITCMNVITGMKTVIEDYDAKTFLDLVAEHRVTQVTLVPTMLRRAIESVRNGHHDVSSLRLVSYGTMPTPPALIRQAYDTLGCAFMQIYGATESGGPVTALRDADHRRAVQSEPELLTSVGRVLPHARVSIRDDLGNALPTGELGSVWLGGETLMAGYVNRPEETQEVLRTPWLVTGDIGRVDERGYIYLGDRKKNMIISGGMNVFPTSVENALAEHPAVSQAVVVGVPHAEWGEAVVGMVTLWPGATATPDELIAHCRDRIPRWEVPKHVEVVRRLPQGFTDKLDKLAVRSSLLESGHLPWPIA
ncbi:MAG: AMP-binding protein [Burkholderiaceae bacterium]|nr:AMP-binding protein [Desulfobacterales bacterium]MDP3136319.1 AMP-binding protein [Burkholderiaceae bacterium]